MVLFPRATGHLAAFCLWAGLLCVLATPTARADEFVSGYVVPYRYLLLSESLRAPSGSLKPFADLAPNEISTLYHELWHAYFLECESKEQGPLFKAFLRDADARYAEFPADKRMEIHEEAVADFVDAAVETFVSVKRFMSRKTPEERAAIRNGSRLAEAYESVFRDSYVGYYTRSVRPREGAAGTSETLAADAAATSASLASAGLGENAAPRYEIRDAKTVLGDFVRDARAFGLPAAYVEKAVAKLDAVVFIRFGPVPRADTGLDSDIVWSNAPLRPADLALIERTLFEGLLVADPNAAFSEKKF